MLSICGGKASQWEGGGVLGHCFHKRGLASCLSSSSLICPGTYPYPWCCQQTRKDSWEKRVGRSDSSSLRKTNGHVPACLISKGGTNQEKALLGYGLVTTPSEIEGETVLKKRTSRRGVKGFSRWGKTVTLGKEYTLIFCN